MAKMKAVQVPKAGAGPVRIRVEACGACRSDVPNKEGGLSGELELLSGFLQKVTAAGVIAAALSVHA